MTAQKNDIMVHCEGLSKIYDEIKALVDLNLEIPRGHIFGYIGHNGAGKTTTIRILAGLLKASHGKATVAGVDVSSSREKIKALVGYMPDSFGVYDQMRVWEYLDFFGAAFKLPRAKRRDRIDYVLNITDAEYMRDRFVDTLSHGMKQRVGIARTLIHDPQVMLLDEPANGLDPQARIQMRNLLRKLADGGKTLLVSSHILPELAVVCDSVGIIHKGVLKAAGPIDKVLSQIRRDRQIEIKVLSDMDELAKALSSASRVSEVDASDRAASIVSFRFGGDEMQLSALLKSLMSDSRKIVTMREVPLSLEEAYMHISGIAPDGSDKSKGA